MLNLIRNEWMKLWNKKSTWIMVGILILLTGGMMGIMKFIDVQNGKSTAFGNGAIEVSGKPDWKGSLQEELGFVEAQLAHDSLSKSERLDLEGQAKVLEYRLANDVEPISPFSKEGMIMNPSSLGGTVLLLTVIVAAGIVASEFSQGTIKMLLTRPVKRWKILTSKFLTVNLFGILLMVIGFIVYIVLSMILFKSGAGQELTWNGKEVVEVSIWSKSLYMLLLSFGNVFVITTFAFTIGSVFRSSSLAIGLSLFIYFSGSMVSALLARYEIAKYLLFTHMDLTQFETGMKLVEDITMPFSLAVLAVYMVIFLIISYTTFVKRDITA
ncbi:ABC transporter permease [Sporosarcina sp. Sa2YVA2]|uniref:ABC transporter permease n=1 Tax=Sporosarcina quadrami TaxID=2762234 RepID=A0ABR8U7M4_9BACL|nr:ABC transporter permease [Sporosarcina quadrami]MBD7984027.1 ABC transporter permease [Sporosarcina quadrami]